MFLFLSRLLLPFHRKQLIEALVRAMPKNHIIKHAPCLIEIPRLHCDTCLEKGFRSSPLFDGSQMLLHPSLCLQKGPIPLSLFKAAFDRFEGLFRMFRE